MSREYEAACAATAEFPALRQLVEAWLPLRRAEADLDAAHASLEECGADDAEVEAAQDRWRAAMDTTREAALRVLDHVATDPHVTMAKVATFMAMSGGRCVEAKDDDGYPNRLVRSLMLDAATQGDLRRDIAMATEAWDAAVAALEQSTADEDRLLAAIEEAADAIEREAPVPEVLKREGGGHYNTEDQITAAKLPFDQKVAMVAALREWLPALKAATARHQFDEKNDAWSNHSISLAEDALIRTSAPNAAALALKLGLVMSRQFGMALSDLQTVEGMSRLLSSPEPDERDLAVTYQDALRLAGLRSDLVAAQAFDVEGWIAAFEAHPGHTLTRTGRLEYQEPKAFGADTLAYQDIMVTEPEAIARFDAYQRSHFTDHQWEAMQAERKRMGWRALEGGNPFIVEDLSQLDAAYPDGGPEYDRLKALWDLRRERLRNCSPTGAHLWRELADWQKEAVREFCRAHPAQFIEAYRWTPEGWVEAAKDAGGTFHLGDDGGFFAGFACPPSFFASRLMRALEDDELRRGVADILRTERGRR